MKISISAIITYYNLDTSILSQCVNSILKQTFENFEIIIINDGSTDDYTNKLDKIALMDDRITIIYQDNQGASVARNTGAEAAKGEYITFVDADDLLIPTFFSEAYAFAKEKKADFVVGAVYQTDSRMPTVVNDAGAGYEVWDARKYKNILTTSIYKLSKRVFIGRGPWARLIKREMFDSVSFPDNIKIGEDLLWNIEMAEKCKQVYIIHTVWYIYWDNPNSILNKYNPEIVQNCEKGLKLLETKFNLNKSEDCKAYCSRVFYLLYRCIYKDYLGNKNCCESYLKKWMTFCDILNNKPWNDIRNKHFFKTSNIKEKIKILLANFRMLFIFYTLKDDIMKIKSILKK